jgi:hypothetical protein
MKVQSTSAVALAAILLVSACGSDEGDNGEGGSLAVGDCAVVVDPTSATPDLQQVDCEDSSAEYGITAAGATADDLGACDFSIQLRDQAYCLGEVGSTADPVTEAENQLDYSTLAPGDCTDATVEKSAPTRVIPCDEPGAKSEVLGLTSDPLDCEGNVAAQRDGVVVCMQTR